MTTPIPLVAVMLVGRRAYGKTFYADRCEIERESARIDLDRYSPMDPGFDQVLAIEGDRSGINRVILDGCNLDRSVRIRIVEAVKRLGGSVQVRVLSDDLSGAERPMQSEGYTSILYVERVKASAAHEDRLFRFRGRPPTKKTVPAKSAKKSGVWARAPQILAQHHRHGTFLYVIRDNEQLYRTALKIATGNAKDIYYQTDSKLDERMRTAVAKQDGKRCWALLKKFSMEYGDYHEVNLSTPESVE